MREDVGCDKVFERIVDSRRGFKRLAEEFEGGFPAVFCSSSTGSTGARDALRDARFEMREDLLERPNEKECRNPKGIFLETSISCSLGLSGHREDLDSERADKGEARPESSDVIGDDSEVGESATALERALLY